MSYGQLLMNQAKDDFKEYVKQIPDKDKLNALADAIENISIPEVEQPQMKYRANGVRLELKEIADKLRKELNDL